MATAAILEVIAEPTRRRILDAVRGGERSVGELVEMVGMHQPGVSRHLKVLRSAGLVEVRRDAQRRLYRLRPEPLKELDAWLEPFRAQWSTQLDSLERHLHRIATPVIATPVIATPVTATPVTATPVTPKPVTPKPFTTKPVMPIKKDSR